MADGRAIIMEVLDRYRAAAEAKNLLNFVALYDEEAQIFDLWGVWEHQGRDAWRSAVAEWFDSLGEGSLVVEIADLHVQQSGDLTAAHALVSYRGISAEGEPLNSMLNRFTWLLIRREDGWKIIHEHSSAPVDLSSGKVMLAR